MSVLSTLSLSLTLLAGLATTVVAEDAPSTLHAGSHHHLRLSLQGMPNDFDIEYDNGSNTITDSRTADSAGRLGIGYFWGGGRPVSFMLGAGLELTGFEFSGTGGEYKIGEAGLFVEPGIAFQPAPWFTAEGGLRLGFGSVNVDIEDSNLTVDDTSYGEVGLHFRGVFMVTRGLELIAEVAYVHQAFEYEYDTGNATIKETVTVKGPVAALGIGWAF